MNRYGLYLVVVLLVLALAAVGYTAFDAGREMSAGPQSVSAVIAARNAGREMSGGGGSTVLWALLLIGGTLAVGFMLWKGSDILRQLRLTFKRKPQRPQPAGEVPAIPRLPAVREVPGPYPQLPARSETGYEP